MRLGIFGPKCQLCGKRGPYVEKIPLFHNPAGYSETYRYHRMCVYEVIAHPEQYGHQIVDLALDILSAQEKQAREETILEGRRRERVAAARERLGL